MKRIIAIVAGGDSSEHDVSMKSAEGIYSFIDKDIYKVYVIELGRKGWNALLEDGSKSAVDKNDFTFMENGQKVKPDFGRERHPARLLRIARNPLFHLRCIGFGIDVQQVRNQPILEKLRRTGCRVDVGTQAERHQR